ncbi:OLC1v1017113C1 [Oldenlandia corymbosa var. corymbosa]|uniref:OLC1v1017113C1 n=1 Tax=Oldenlandia corymbosa var. corymbosa TaxID=529605 RepID=A0AAV1E8T1_OLDCO|nr:OLC1v1017113C1 [Oldenlandia corymbosa var. corymbosa]
MASTTEIVTVLKRYSVSPPPPSSTKEMALPLTFLDMVWLQFLPIERLVFYEIPQLTRAHFIDHIVPKLELSLSIALENFLPLAALFNPTLYNADSDSGSDKIIPVLGIQVTLFPNSGISIAISNHHSAGDASTIFQFMKTWADLSFQLQEAGDSVSSKSLDIEKLKSLALENREKVLHLSSFTVSVAYVWTCLVKSRAPSGEDVGAEDPELFTFWAECRGRMNPPLPENYFGNYMTLCITETEYGKLAGEGGFQNAVELIGKTIHERLKNSETLFLGAEHWMEGLHDEKWARNVGVAGSPKFSYYNLDFGWGKAVKFEFASIDLTGAISLNGCRDPEGVVEVGLSMPKPKMDAFTTIFNEGLHDRRTGNEAVRRRGDDAATTSGSTRTGGLLVRVEPGRVYGDDDDSDTSDTEDSSKRKTRSSQPINIPEYSEDDLEEGDEDEEDEFDEDDVQDSVRMGAHHRDTPVYNLSSYPPPRADEVPGGPIDGSVIPSFLGHIAYHFWHGYNRPTLKIFKGEKILNKLKMWYKDMDDDVDGELVTGTSDTDLLRGHAAGILGMDMNDYKWSHGGVSDSFILERCEKADANTQASAFLWVLLASTLFMSKSGGRPRVHDWIPPSFARPTSVSDRLRQVRERLDCFTELEVKWEPFGPGQQGIVPRTIYSGWIMYRNIQEPYMPDRCIRQIGYVQSIPRSPMSPDDAFRGPRTTQYFVQHSSVDTLNTWRRFPESACLNLTRWRYNYSGDIVGECEDGYLEWYSSIHIHFCCRQPTHLQSLHQLRAIGIM